MSDIKTKQLKKRLSKLEKFTDKDKAFEEEQIFNWVAECVSIFVEIGVNREIINGFMKTFEFDSKEEKPLGAMSSVEYGILGPFVKIETSLDYYTLTMTEKMSYITIAFTAAKSILRKGIEENSIIPKILVKELKGQQKSKNIANILELIEYAYQKRDKQKLLIETNNLLEEILDLDLSIKKQRSIKAKLNKIKADPIIKGKFGNPSNDVLNALDNNRIIRNKKAAHTKIPLKYNVSLLVAVSYVYLVTIFLEITVSNGELIK